MYMRDDVEWRRTAPLYTSIEVNVYILPIGAILSTKANGSSSTFAPSSSQSPNTSAAPLRSRSLCATSASWPLSSNPFSTRWAIYPNLLSFMTLGRGCNDWNDRQGDNCYISNTWGWYEGSLINTKCLYYHSRIPWEDYGASDQVSTLTPNITKLGKDPDNLKYNYLLHFLGSGKFQTWQVHMFQLIFMCLLLQPKMRLETMMLL